MFSLSIFYELYFQSQLVKLYLIRGHENFLQCLGFTYFSIIYSEVIFVQDERYEVCKSLSCVRLFETPWTVAHQTPLSLEFSRQEYWSGLPFHSSRRSSQTQGSNPHLLCLLHLQTGSLLNQGGSPFSTFSCYKFTCDKICLLVSLHSFSSHQYVSPLFFYFKILFLIDNTFCYCIFMDNAIYLKLFYIIFN